MAFSSYKRAVAMFDCRQELGALLQRATRPVDVFATVCAFGHVSVNLDHVAERLSGPDRERFADHIRNTMAASGEVFTR